MVPQIGHMDTLPLDIEDKTTQAPKPRSKRLRPRKVELTTGTAYRKAPAGPPTLLKSPQQRTCGFCGRRETVNGDAVLCSQCGSVIVRDE
jgi:hypothetical protein